MSSRIFLHSLVCFLLLLALCDFANAQEQNIDIVFMEADRTSEADTQPTYRLVTDPTLVKKYTSWLENESARLAIDLYKRAWLLIETDNRLRSQPPVYYLALVPGGNHADIGFRLRSKSGLEKHTQTAYLKLAPENWAFSTTLLHESGHVLLSMLNGGKEIPKEEIASISHTTAALTDRGTAFDEGFAIHLETLAAHLTSDPVMKNRYYHQQFLFGFPQLQGEYHRHAADLLSFSQTIARYYEIRENNFAFAPAFRGPDYLRVQLEKARDFATVRDANQLLQSEGFYASFFFSFLVRGNSVPTAEVLRERQNKILQTLAEMFRSRAIEPDSPFLLYFVERFMQRYPQEANEIVDVLLDLSHGVFVDDRAAALWREHYLGALRLDLAQRNNEKIEAARTRWRAEVIKNPKVLYARLGPQIRCEVERQSVMLVAFGKAAPLSFDVNTAEEGILQMIAGITDSQVDTWLRQRRTKAFTDVEDFKKRSGLTEQVLASLKFGRSN